MNVVASAPGKTILSGEHAVVYGQPAISMSIPFRTTVEIGNRRKGTVLNKKVQKIIRVILEHYSLRKTIPSIHISSEIPQNAGLGSSAALSCAVAKAITRYYGIVCKKEQLYDLVQTCEEIFHGKPSGIDATTVVYEQCMRFQRYDDHVIAKPLSSASNIPRFMLINSGSAVESTRDMVELVRKNLRKDKILRTIGSITLKLEESLQKGHFDFELISENQQMLEQLGVVGETACSIIRVLEKAGSYAKITGAGGLREGSGMVLAFHKDISVLEHCCSTNAFDLLIGGDKT